MKRLVLSSLMTVLVSQAAGCVITTEENATILAQWSLKQQATNQIIPCPPNITTAAVYSQEVDTAFRPIGSPIIDLFDCDDNSGRTAALAPSVYQVWVELTSEGGGTVHARSLSQFVDVIDVDKTFQETILNDGGYFQFDWTLVDSANNAPLTCATGQVDGVASLSVHSTTSSLDRTDIFDCADGTGVTAGLLAGTYDVQISARDPQMVPIGPPTLLDSRVVGDRNQVTDLGVVTVAVD